MKKILFIMLLLYSNAKAENINVTELSNDELLDNIFSYLNNQNKNNLNSDLYKKSFAELDSRSKKENPSAKLYRALLDYRICIGAENIKLNTPNQPLCSNAYKVIKSVTTTNLPILGGERALAFEVLGEMYKNGVGVNISNVLAADSYVSAALEHNKYDFKEGVLRDTEEALSLHPRHPKALKLQEEALSK